jgi:RND family efflux transporter MFP subunit
MNNHIKRAVFAILSLFLISGCAEKAPEKEIIRPVKAMKVADFDEVMRRKFPGRAYASEDVELSFRIPGRLKTLPVDVGDEVKKGDVVARLDPHDFQVRQQAVQGELETGRAALKRAASDYDRVVRIRDKDPGAISEAMIDAKLGARDSAKAQVKSLEAALVAAKDNVRYTYLRAPWNGTVVKKYIENFQDVMANQKVMRLVDDSRIEFNIDVPEHLIVLAPYVTKLFVEFDTFPGRKITATIKEIGREASQTTRTYPVTLLLEKSEDIKILPGMAGIATADSIPPEALTEKGIQVPASAVFSSDEKDAFYMWVIDEATQTAHRREVKVGKLSSTGISIAEGLKPGEWVATAAVHSIREGQKVRILKGAEQEISK